MFKLQTHPSLELLIRLSGFFRNIPKSLTGTLRVKCNLHSSSEPEFAAERFAVSYTSIFPAIQTPCSSSHFLASQRLRCVAHELRRCAIQFRGAPLTEFAGQGHQKQTKSWLLATVCHSILLYTVTDFFPKMFTVSWGSLAYPPTAITYQPSRTGWNWFGGNNLRDTAENHRKPRIAHQLIFCLDACCLSCLPGMTMWTKCPGRWCSGCSDYGQCMWRPAV